MTKREFLEQIPDTIQHKAHGYSELEIIEDSSKQKWVCYRSKENISSWSTYGNTWQEVFDRLSTNLIQQGYMVAN